ncbi:hypothetical protein TNCV_4482921 [Trichonephila clavipes]|nr:hypothetical protein TNCV_4482921 [Trichonephila clavipes]
MGNDTLSQSLHTEYNDSRNTAVNRLLCGNKNHTCIRKLHLEVIAGSHLGPPSQPLTPRRTLFPLLAGCNWMLKAQISYPRSEKREREN